MHAKKFALALPLLILTLLPAPLARADDASKIAKIHEFFRITKMGELTDHTMNVTFKQITTRLTGRLAGAQLTPSQRRQVEEFTVKVRNLITTNLSWEKLEPEYTKLYADAYTEQQIDDLIAFYKTPTGQVVIEKAPMLTQQASEIARQHLTAAMPELKQLSDDPVVTQTTVVGGGDGNSDQ